jgi:hypothetical protein
VQQGELTRAEADRLKIVNDEITKLRKEAIARERQARIERETAAAAERKLELDEADLSNRQEVLEAQGALATTAEDRREIELQLLELQLEEQRLRLRAIIAMAERVKTSETANAEEKRDAEAQAELARGRLQTLDKIEAGQREGVMRDTAGPIEAYGRSLKRTSAEVNEDFERIAVSGLQSLNDQLADAIMNGESLGEVFHNVANSIIRDLIRIAIQQLVVKTIMNAMGVSMPSGGMDLGGMVGTSSAGSGSFFDNLSGMMRATGGPVTSGKPYIVGERGPELMVPGRSGTVVPNTELARMTTGGAGGMTIALSIPINAPGATAETVAMIDRRIRAAAPVLVSAAQRATMKALTRTRS